MHPLYLYPAPMRLQTSQPSSSALDSRQSLENHIVPQFLTITPFHSHRSKTKDLKPPGFTSLRKIPRGWSTSHRGSTLRRENHQSRFTFLLTCDLNHAIL